MGINSQNLKPWPKGVSGNPGGRPRKKLIDYALEELLLDNDSELAVVIARKLLARAKKGELKAIQLIAERIEGKPTRQAELDRNEGAAPNVESMTLEEINKRMGELFAEWNAEKSGA